MSSSTFPARLVSRSQVDRLHQCSSVASPALGCEFFSVPTERNSPSLRWINHLRFSVMNIGYPNIRTSAPNLCRRPLRIGCRPAGLHPLSLRSVIEALITPQPPRARAQVRINVWYCEIRGTADPTRPRRRPSALVESIFMSVLPHSDEVSQ